MLNLSNNYLGEKFGATLANSLRKNKFLSDLNISNNDIKPQGGKLLAHSLDGFHVNRLNLSENSIGQDAGNMLATSLKKNKSLVSLDISRNSLGTMAVKNILNSLAENETLIQLNIAKNGAGPDTLKYLGKALGKNCSLISLNLSQNQLGTPSYLGGDGVNCCNELQKGLSTNLTLVDLNMSNCGIRDADMVLIATGLKKNRTLKYIDLSDHPLREVSVVQVSSRLQYTPMEVLRLNRCQINLRAGEIMMQALTRSKKLKVLELGNSRLGPQPTLLMARYLSKKISYLEELNLEGNNISMLGGIALCRALKVNTSLKVLNIARNSLGVDFSRELAESVFTVYYKGRIVRSCHLTHLNLSHNYFGDQGVKRILNALRGNDSLSELLLANTGMSYDSSKKLAEILKSTFNRFNYLDISENELSRIDINNILWSLRTNANLRCILFAKNNAGPGFGTDQDELEEYGIPMIEALCTNYSLKTIDMSSNQLSNQCGEYFPEVIDNNTSIETINFSHNNFKSEAFFAFSDALCYSSTVREVNLSHNFGGYKGACYFAKVLEKNFSLISLDLSYNELGNNGTVSGKEIGKAVKYNSSLRKLNLSGNKLGPEGGRILAKGLLKNKTLTHIWLENNRFDVSVAEAMIPVAEGCEYIKILELSEDEILTDCYAKLKSILQERGGA